jgi:putative ABC transport system substrate-binding protein
MSGCKALRKLLLLVVAACIACSNFAAAQRAPLPRIGELWAGTELDAKPWREPYLEGMRELGWIDGQTTQFIVRYDQGDPARLPSLATELLSLDVDVIVVVDGTLAAARKATATVPIVCLDMYDPVAQRLTSSLAKPGGNVTGVSWNSIETAVKRLELAKELLPNLRRAGLLTDASDPGAVLEADALRAKAASEGLRLRTFEVREAADFPKQFAAIKQHRPELLIVSTNALTHRQLNPTVRLTSSTGIPTVSEASSFAEAGLLLTYGPDYISTYKRGAVQVDKVLKGMKPGSCHSSCLLSLSWS